MPTLTIDGKQITVDPGTKVIEAALRLGIEIPRYCYHPGLSIAGNCRICMVEIEKMPRTQISCNTDCTEGMVVRTNSDKVKETRRYILEFLLVNHPLDCPVCDQAGECWLQDYYMKYGLYDGRFYEEKVKKPKAVVVGPNVILDAERCILCSRCVRFCDEITKTSELGIVNRGDRGEIQVAPGRELDNKYSANVVDICPVGALTDRDFRFKCRVWYLQKQDSICTGCARGCNTEIHYNLDRPQHGGGDRVMRLKPRENQDVNKWWLCDAGRYSYKFIDENRIEQPSKRGLAPFEEKRNQKGPGPFWSQVLDDVAALIKNSQKPFGVFASPQLSNEELYLVRKLFSSNPQARITLLSPNLEGDQDDFLIRADKNPNTMGARLIGFEPTAIDITQIEGAIIFGQEVRSVEKLRWSVFIGSNQNLISESASFVLPSATYAEKNATFTNFQGRVQKFNKAFEPLGESRPEWKILQDLANRLGASWKYPNEEEIFNELVREVPAFHGLSYEKIRTSGYLVKGGKKHD